MNGPFKIGEIRPIQYFLSIGVIIGLLFSMIAEGDESASAIVAQVIQWQLQVLIPLFILIATHTFLHKFIYFDKLNPWLKLFISGLIGAIIFSPLALYIDGLYDEGITQKFASALLHEFVAVAPPVIVSWIAINAPWLLGFQLIRSENNTDSEQKLISNFEEATDLIPDFYQLLPENIRAELIYLKAELHYLKVVTVKGSALILFNLKDAIRQLNTRNGIKTHRSYWVAKKFIHEFNKSGRQAILLLGNGDEIPVSRNQVISVKQFLLEN